MAERQPVFFYDLGDPLSYLAAERVNLAVGAVPEWEPVHAAASGLAVASAPRREAVVRQAEELGLQPLRWPPAWPPDSTRAMLAARYAKHVGRAVAFSLAAFRQAFAGGRDLGDLDTVLIAGAACEMHPAALLKGMELRGVREGLAGAGARARALGLRELPALWLGGETVQGEECFALVSRGGAGAHPGAGIDAKARAQA
jgi:2-hydroxychromene-2-carboxylate isomerase